MNPFSAIYGLGVAAKNALYDRKLFAADKLEGPVISVGNLSVGGSGKTPFVLLLGELLKARGIKFDVLSRGYGRKTGGVALVDPNGFVRDFGDEPLLISRKLGVFVVVGESRYEAGLFAESKFGPQLHLLDDGFQHRKLARDFDIVLVTPEDARDQLLPVGRLREPLSSLQRADAIVLTNGAPADDFPVKNCVTWRTQRGLALRDVPPRPLVFCGIARPDNFWLEIKEAGVVPSAHRFFRDHHAYSQEDVNELLRLKQQTNGAGFLTTEKDAVNLGSLESALQPLSIARVRLALDDADSALDTMLRRIRNAQPKS